MDFNYTDTQVSIAEMIRDFANKHIRPEMMEWDEAQKFPIDLFHKMGELGLMDELGLVDGPGLIDELSLFEEAEILELPACASSKILTPKKLPISKLPPTQRLVGSLVFCIPRFHILPHSLSLHRLSISC